MSSKYVRDLARTWLQAGSVTFQDTINRPVGRPSLPVWVTVEFYATTKQGLLGCPGYIENGVIDLMFMATAGTGDDAILTALEAAVVEFMQNTDPAGKLTLLEDETVREVSGGDGDGYYRLGVGVTYAYTV